MEKNRVLAMYDVRGKQSYIYGTNKIREIIGASGIIRDVFKDYLYPAANTFLGGNTEDAIYHNNTNDFKVAEFEKRMQIGKSIGEVVYEGGGNFFVLFRDREAMVEVNKIFYKNLMIKTGALQVLCSCIEGIHYEDYKNDEKKLRHIHRIREGREPYGESCNVLPFTQVDSMLSKPLTDRVDGGEEKLPRERAAKIEKYNQMRKANKETYDEKYLDRIVKEKGEDSLLAVVYIDGNSMGAKVREITRNCVTYEECINMLRRFSVYIQEVYVEQRQKEIWKKLDRYGKRRAIIAAGDEMTFICRADLAMEAVLEYFTGLSEPKEKLIEKYFSNTKSNTKAITLEEAKKVLDQASSCAGICIFHSHAPFSEAYKIAEECCESGKTRMKEQGLGKANLIDFQFCQSGFGNSLDNIRQSENGETISRPWYLEEHSDTGEVNYTLTLVNELASELRKFSRTNIKDLAACAKKGSRYLKMELARMIAHRSDKTQQIDFSLQNRLSEEDQLRLIYDIVYVYDLWFQEGVENE